MNLFRVTYEDESQSIIIAKSKDHAVRMIDDMIAYPEKIESIDSSLIDGLTITQSKPLSEYTEPELEECIWLSDLEIDHYDCVSDLFETKGNRLKLRTGAEHVEHLYGHLSHPKHQKK